MDSEAKNGLKIEKEVFIYFYFGPEHKISFKSDYRNPVKQQLSKFEFGIFQGLFLWQQHTRGQKRQINGKLFTVVKRRDDRIITESRQ